MIRRSTSRATPYLKAVLVCALASGLFAACAGSPSVPPPPVVPANEAAPPPQAVETPPPPQVVEPSEAVEPPARPPEAFNPAAVPEERKAATVADVRTLIENLNRIIQRKDYEAWLGYLTDDYIAYFSNPKVLAEKSEYPVLKRAGIKLLTLKDYFTYVVYPSRQNDRLDDIEYVEEGLIKAISVSPKGERNILYWLEKHGNTWKIGIGR